jgi:hypothetical protein
MRVTLTGPEYAEDPAVGNGRVLGKHDQAAELELSDVLDVAGLESDDELDELDEEELEDALDELDDFEAGELLDEAPRLSLR